MLLLLQRFILYKFNLQLYMKIYDCFMFFDEEMLLDLRLNIMDKYVDKFVITEATYMHSGESKKLLFDINKFSKFKDKIIYIVVQFTADQSAHGKGKRYTEADKTQVQSRWMNCHCRILQKWVQSLSFSWDYGL